MSRLYALFREMRVAALVVRQKPHRVNNRPKFSDFRSAFIRPSLSNRHPIRAVRSMSTVTLEKSGIQVKLPDGLSEDQLLGFRPFNDWVKSLGNTLSLQAKNKDHPFHQDPYHLRGITVQAFDIFGSGRVGFLKVSADVKNGAGEGLPASVFLRGPSVGMLVMLIPDDAPPDSDERYVVLTVQPRVPVGSLSFVELPAGMVDDSGSFAGAAAKEIQEELGLEIHESKLTCLSELAGAGRSAGNEAEEGLAEAMYPSAGGCDEFVTLYSHDKRIPRRQLKDWSGKLTGLRDHGEKITLKLVPMKDLWREGARDSKCLAALALWEGLRREGMI
ncbi:NUDIX domain-containing protein [Colletotrichum orchidophilum]|uniref:NUDIX domain-containing protein n=1 Tax=Colletotrichum orchidophilum TaxID=1209926 RepID=A0A1G4BEB7_9PEZI|nr:NUDIX domain-containing protein [Colletotrichum orchidophilum]OHE99740.1 NUDIX domain-containing protein [Colletotrichum orchidophilum]